MHNSGLLLQIAVAVVNATEVFFLFACLFVLCLLVFSCYVCLFFRVMFACLFMLCLLVFSCNVCLSSCLLVFSCNICLSFHVMFVCLFV